MEELKLEIKVLKDTNKKWIESTLKLEYIIKQMLYLGFIPEDHLDWIKPMFESIEIPDVSINVRNKYVPTVQDNEIIDDGDNNEQINRIQYLSEEASYFNDLLGKSISDNIALDRIYTLNCIIKIQSYFRMYLSIKIYNLINKGNIIEKNKSAIIIQKNIRKYKNNSIQKITNEVYEYFYINKYLNNFNNLRKNITFVNSSINNIEVTFINSLGIPKKKYIIKGFNDDKIENNMYYNKKLSTFVNHKFSVIGSNINHNIRITSFLNNKNVYDVYSGFLFSLDDWKKIIKNKYPNYFNIYMSHWKENKSFSNENNIFSLDYYNYLKDDDNILQLAILSSLNSL